ncbi:MAG: hypothetical protein AAFY91_12405 [Bacteroidota bacterium]
MPTKDRIIRFHAALSGAKMMNYKADMLSAYGVESTKDLTNRQADELIDRLNKMQSNRKDAPPQVRRWWSVVLDLLTKLEVYSDNRDWSSVNRYLLDPRIAGKLLYEHNLEELKALSKKLRKILKQREEATENEAYLATNN